MIHKDKTFLIIGSHPHKGELCHLMGDTENTVTFIDGIGVLVTLVNCPHLMDECYVPRDNLRLVDED